MPTFEDASSQFYLLVGHTSPITHRLAADRIHSMSDMARTADERIRVMQSANVWLSTLATMLRMGQRLSQEAMPLVALIRKEMIKGTGGEDSGEPVHDANGPLCDECKAHDGFFDDIPFDKRPSAPDPKVRPSKVTQPGPLDPLLNKVRGMESEDELRALCVFGPRMWADGRMPHMPLVPSRTIKASNATIVRMYRERRIDRTWTSPPDWEVDTALVEDITLLLILVRGECSTDRIALHAHHLLPFMRRWDAVKLGFACRRAHEKFIRAKMIARCKPRTFELTLGWEEKLRPTLLAAWERAEDPPREAEPPAPIPGGVQP